MKRSRAQHAQRANRGAPSLPMQQKKSSSIQDFIRRKKSSGVQLSDQNGKGLDCSANLREGTNSGLSRFTSMNENITSFNITTETEQTET